MEITANTKNFINLNAVSNNTDVDITGVGGNFRYINIGNAVKTDMDDWEIRTADADHAVTSLTLSTSIGVVADTTLLRKGDVLECFNVADYVTCIKILEITDATHIKITESATIPFTQVELDSVTKFVLRADPLRLEERTKTFESRLFKYLVIEADADLELIIESLTAGACQ